MSPGASFGGEIGLVGLFDVSQLLTLNRASGTLQVTSAGLRGFLYFLNGRIVNAADETQAEGELASYRVLSWKRGRFEFHPGPPGCAIRIDRAPESLLLEAARRMDEGADDEPNTLHETEKLQEHAREMVALRDAFDDVAREAGRAGSRDQADLDELLGMIRDAEDRLLLRVGQPPRLWSAGEWTEIGGAFDAAHLATAMERLSARAETGPDERHIVRLDAERAVVLTGYPGADALWIAPIELPPLTSAMLRGALDRLTELIDLPRALILGASETPAAARRLFRTLVALIAARRPGVLLLVSEDRTCRYVDGAGVVVQVPPAHALECIRRLRPNVVALDAATIADAALFGAIATVPTILGTVIANELEDVLPLWLPELPQGVRVAPLLSSIRVGVIVADAPASDEIPMTFRVRLLVRALRGLRARRHTPISADPLGKVRR